MLRKIRSIASALTVVTATCLATGAPAQDALLTLEDVKRISPNAQDAFAQALVDASEVFEDHGITTRLRMAHFIAQVMTETGGLKRLDENMNYSYATLMRVFSRRTISEPKARAIARQPQQIANWVYGARLGNRGRDTQDGWNYRGSGFIQLTGRANFRARGAEVGLPLEDQPEMARQAREGLAAALAYWSARDINAAADDHDRLRVRKLVNGPAAHGYDQSVIWFNRAWLRVFRDKEALGFEGAIALAENQTQAPDDSALFDNILEQSGIVPKDQPATEAGLEEREAALRQFQTELGLPETGELDDATQEALLDPREWRHLDDTAIADAPLVRDPEASVTFDFSDEPMTAGAPVALTAFAGTGIMAEATRLSPQALSGLGDASAIYSEYEMGGRSVTPEMFLPFSVIGEDERVAVINTTTFPERAVVQILFESGFGQSLCSGTMVSPDTVLTAAHCIHSGTISGRTYSDFLVIPARNTGSSPFGECRAQQAYVLAGWTESLSPEDARYYDLGALKLDCEVGEATGWMGVALLDAQQEGAQTVVRGYAADKSPPGRQWKSEDSLRVLWDLKGFYQNDTFGGTSGAPVYLATEDTVLVGVHTNGLHGAAPWSDHNAFTRITPERLERVRQWIGGGR
ncbi:trypsin-like serine protease [Marivita sp. S2033]|uniref:trypsin-like serine protease n=1 Tax=Marivita sp. S2033 TaxID=3373187 RepID=UPI00398220B6